MLTFRYFWFHSWDEDKLKRGSTEPIRYISDSEDGSGLFTMNIISWPISGIMENMEIVLEEGDDPISLMLHLNDSKQRINTVTSTSGFQEHGPNQSVFTAQSSSDCTPIQCIRTQTLRNSGPV
jgi:hypothetical protein